MLAATRVLYTGLRAPARWPQTLDLEHLPLLRVEPLALEREPAFALLLHPQPVTLVCYSPRGARSALDALGRLGLDPRQALAPHTIWAVGQRTAQALAPLSVLCPEPSQARFEGLVRALRARQLAEDLATPIVSLGLEDGERSLAQAMPERQVHELAAYATHPIDGDAIRAALARRPDWILWMSPRGVAAALAAARDDAQAEAALRAASHACVGPTTSAALRDALGRAPQLEPPRPEVEATLDLIAQAAR